MLDDLRPPEWLGCSAECFVFHVNGGFWGFTLRRAQQSNVRGSVHGEGVNLEGGILYKRQKNSSGREERGKMLKYPRPANGSRGT